MTQADYTKMTQDEFDEILLEVIGNKTPLEILSAADSDIREEFKNEVLDIWAERNPEKAWSSYYQVTWLDDFADEENDGYPGDIFQTKEDALKAINDVYNDHDTVPAESVDFYEEGAIPVTWDVVLRINLVSPNE